CRLERGCRALVEKIVRGKTAELVVHDGNQPFEGCRVAGLQVEQQPRDVRASVHRAFTREGETGSLADPPPSSRSASAPPARSPERPDDALSRSGAKIPAPRHALNPATKTGADT